MTTDYEYFRNKREDRVYLSKSLEQRILRPDAEGNVHPLTRPFRIVSKVINCQESHQFFKDGSEVSLRITSGGKQEIKAKFYEDTREVFALQLQKYTMESGTPHQTYFTFTGKEIATLFNFIRNTALLPINEASSQRLLLAA